MTTRGAASTAGQWHVLYRAAPSRAVRVRLFMWLTPLVPAVIALVLWWYSHDSAAFAADFGTGITAVLGPLGIVALAALLPFGAWLLHGSYVAELAADVASRRLRVTLVTAWGSRVLEDEAPRFVAGPVRMGGGSTVFTPTLGLVAPGGRRLVIDLQGATWSRDADRLWRAIL